MSSFRRSGIAALTIAIVCLSVPVAALGAVEKVTDTPYHEAAVRVSGDYVVYVATTGAGSWPDNEEIYTHQLSTGVAARLTDDGVRQYQASISGNRVVWTDYRSITVGWDYDVFGYDIQSALLGPVASAAGAQYQPSVSGDRVVWVDNRDDISQYVIYTEEPGTGSEHAVSPGLGGQWTPEVSAQRVVWSDQRSDDGDIYLYDFSTPPEMPLCTAFGAQWEPDISGDIVVWTDERSGTPAIWFYDLSTSDTGPLFGQAAPQYHARVSGSRIVWQASGGVFLYDLATQNAKYLGQGLYPDIDGDTIVWQDDSDGDWDIYLYDWEMPTGAAEVTIDIKPGSERNPVNPKSQGVLPVAVFSSSTFDATDIDPSTVLLAGAPVAQNPDDGGWMMHEQDENGDGLMDVRLHFETEQINTELLVDELAIMTGLTFGGIAFQGSDHITIVPKDLANDSWALEAIAECMEGDVVKGYPDGSYLPDVKVSRAQMAAFVSRAHAGGDDAVPEGPEKASFPDVPPDHWAYDCVEYATANAIVTGYAGGTYQPSWIVTRGQMAVFIARAKAWVSLDDDLTTAPELFQDVPAGYWAGKAVEACVSHGVVQGYLDGSYRPAAAVTRDQMAVYIARAWELPM